MDKHQISPEIRFGPNSILLQFQVIPAICKNGIMQGGAFMTLIDIFTNFALTCSHEGLITYLTANLTFQSARPAKLDDLILMLIDIKYKKKKYALVECNFYT